MHREPFGSVDQLIAAIGSLDGVPSDDVVASLPHLLQTAELLASASSDEELIVAGLVHDIASALDPSVGDHARAGAALVAPLLGERVASLVAGHTDAKRYLVAVDESYAMGLSPNSAHTLVGQGGPMNKAERAVFTSHPISAALVALRRADDAAKVPDRSVPAAATWRSMLDRVASMAGPPA